MSVAVTQIPTTGCPAEDDLELVRRCRNRDQEAFREIFRCHHQKVFNISYRILGDRALAEDALQETFLNVFRGLRFFRGDSKVSTWINRIAVNVCLGLIRKSKRAPTVELEGTPETFRQGLTSPSPGPLESFSAGERRERVRDALEGISDKHSTVVRMHDLEGHTISQIAAFLDVPAGTVKSRLFYGRKEFKDCYQRNIASRSLN